MTLIRDAPLRLSPGPQRPAAEPPQTPRPARRRNESAFVLAVSFACYFTTAMLLDFKYNSFEGDAIARMANGFYVLHARDPHLAAVGFVWNPLSSLAELPLLAFNSAFPVLASHNVAGTIVSALAMACAAYQLHELLREWGLSVGPRLILIAFFVFNPMILYFGGNGMSEALYLFTMLAAARYLSRWLRDGDVLTLVYCATALGIGYLERSELIAAAALVVPLVFLVTHVRTPADRRGRIWTGMTDVTVLLLPIVTAFVGWAVVSYVITGQPFQQFESKYGNATLLANAHQAATTLHSRLVHEIVTTTYMAPLLIIIVITALAVAVFRRNIGAAGFLLILTGGLGFTLASYLANAIFPWYRYYILVVPIEVLCIGSMFAVPVRLKELPRQRERRRGAIKLKLGGSVSACVVAIVLLGASIPGTAIAMNNRNIAPDVVQYTGFIFHPNSTDPYTLSNKNAYGEVLAVTRYLEARHFANGDVVVDNANSCIPNVDTNLDNPRIFVIHNDRDFQRVLDDPLTFNAHYLMVGQAINNDAVLAQYPNIANDTSFAKLVHKFNYPIGICKGFSLYKVIAHPGLGS